MNWKLNFEASEDSHEILIDTTILSKTMMAQIMESQGKFLLQLHMNFLQATFRLFDFIEERDFIDLHEAKWDLTKAPISRFSTLHGGQAQTFLDVIGINPLMTMEDFSKLTFVKVTWNVDHDSKMQHLASIMMHVTCEILI